MRMPELAAMWVLLLLLLSTVAEAVLPRVVVLERRPQLKGLPLPHLRDLDKARHARTGVVNLSVEGSFIRWGGLYYTSVKLGNPAKKHTFQIDTGSSIPWVSCKGCTGCSTNNIAMGLYNPDSSSTSSRISCLDDRCDAAEQSGSKVCQTSDSSKRLCGFNITYGDQTTASGYYVSDNMYFDIINGNQSITNSSASVIFGCTNSLNNLMETDGILGFGRDPLSIISQLNSQGISPKSFSQCLKGSEDGGGILVLGKIVASGLVYTPLVPSQSLYNLNLESIAVNGKKLPIDSSVFATSDSQGTVVDSGTTLAYMVEGAYVPFISAIDAATSPSVTRVDTRFNRKEDRDIKCYVTSSSIDLVFPTATLYFKGGAAMTLKPLHYLTDSGSNDGPHGHEDVWCVAWQSSKVLQDVQGLTLLGDVVLHDKLIVYDLEKKRLGWTDYNCSSFNRTSPIDASSASTYYNGSLIAIVVTALFLGGFLP